ncbi:TetR/AcrR family transcriptional regulator [Nocardia mangyaensis]|uniref:TetR/AcrR family transcriptional regulator n=1 Tax=Nocardia mangyaensis TaxID=2213200 RepID=UPI002676B31B|nr:TetR/AcrR family transcriptional regulator [Nocardia mangyaensis]MDO3647496.1 TetR/AcrR family transcriptional regulator [Nocardia mangyaensis]
MAADTRDRILDAMETLLLERGASQLTLENVAAAAGVSKGGLLYHFKSKDAMLAGLVHRLGERARDHLAAARAQGSSTAEWYLQSPDPTEPADAIELTLYRSMLATMRTIDASTAHSPNEIQQALGDVLTSWSDNLDLEIDDPVRADTIRLVGDGVYLRALLGLPPVDPDRYRQVVDRLLER